MNDPASSTPQGLTLKVSFDIDQDDSLLTARFVPKTGTADPTTEGEPYAGSVVLPQGETIGLEVTGTGKPSFSFDIVDCHFVTRPRIVQTGDEKSARYSRPSPFAGVEVPWCQLAPLFTAAAATTQDAKQSVTRTWGGTLQVSDVPGCWNLSFFLTVAITRARAPCPQVRVFWFSDPEGEVGTGAVIHQGVDTDSK